jgi:hypothetical protein
MICQKMIRDEEPESLNILAASIPLRTGMEMSVTMTSGFIFVAAWTTACLGGLEKTRHELADHGLVICQKYSYFRHQIRLARWTRTTTVFFKLHGW